jgi:hypothetical protein
LRDVEDEVEQVLLLDVDGAGEVHVMRLKPVGDEGHEQNVAVGALSGFLADGRDQEVVDVEGHVVAVVLDGADGQDDDGLVVSAGDFAELGPGVVLVEVRDLGHGGFGQRTTAGVR